MRNRFSRGAPLNARWAQTAIAGTCVPHAAPNDVGAVHHDTSLDARPLVDWIVVFLWSAAGLGSLGLKLHDTGAGAPVREPANGLHSGDVCRAMHPSGS